MAIRVRLDYLLLDRRLSLTDLAARVGMTIANLSILKTNKAKAIRFSTLDALCRELKCQPGDLLVRTPDAGPELDWEEHAKDEAKEHDLPLVRQRRT
jgi:putative transcriptional regulator